jgi:small-conductance mechanosensitive channel
MNFEFSLTQRDWTDAMSALIAFAVTLFVAVLAGVLMNQIKKRLASRTTTQLDDLLLGSMVVPVVLVIFFIGLYVSLRLVSALDLYRGTVDNYFVAAAIVVGGFAVARVLDALMSWYALEIAHHTETDLDEKLVPIFRRVVNVVVFGIVLMIILDRFNVEISPLVASLGIGGLAVALAVQPFLASFLAGTFVVADAIVKKDDYIELDSGQTGYVESVGWRTTKIRHWQGNLVILPNSKLANAVVINYESPEPPMTFFVPCGVSYDTDLQKAEEVALEVASQVTQDCSEAIHDFEPLLRWRAFGDSNIDFIVILKGVNRVAHFVVRHEFIKALHKRFSEEGIEINYPARKIQFSNELQIRTNDIDIERRVGESREKAAEQSSTPDGLHEEQEIAEEDV